jgi:hypothetical protein
VDAQGVTQSVRIPKITILVSHNTHEYTIKAGLAIKNPPKKPKNNHLKKPLTFFFVFLVFFIFYFLFFMKIIQTLLFETDFL